jgi:probable blue pigment (indigoidine) exporter
MNESESDAVRASMWYLCPVFGFFYAAVLAGESLTGYTFVRTVLVLVPLNSGQGKPKAQKKHI